jgi:hypothetical protein
MADRPVKVVAAACDGACSGNPGPGGWGALLRYEDGSVQELGGATVMGPLIVGLDKPVQIVQLGAKDTDIVNMAALAAFNIGG